MDLIDEGAKHASVAYTSFQEVDNDYRQVAGLTKARWRE